MKIKFLAIGILACLAVSATARAADITDSELAHLLVVRADSLMRGRSNHSTFRMTVTRPDWSRSLTLESWEKGRDLSFIVVKAPPKEAGTAFLKREGQMWSWLPDVERSIKIPPSMMMESWMGSDFSNDDLVHESSLVNDYDQAIVRRDTLNGAQCAVVRLTPHKDAAVVWDKIDYWVRLSDIMPLREEFYDETGALVRVMNLDNIRKMGGRTLPTRWTLVPQLEKGRETVLEILDAKFDIDIPDRIFTRQHLERAR